MADDQPGSFNINFVESLKRYFGGILGLITGFLLRLAYCWLSALLYIIIFAFIAFTGGLLGILQTRKTFCVKHARLETKKTCKEKVRIGCNDQIQHDRNTAGILILQAFGLGIGLTGVPMDL